MIIVITYLHLISRTENYWVVHFHHKKTYFDSYDGIDNFTPIFILYQYNIFVEYFVLVGAV